MDRKAIETILSECKVNNVPEVCDRLQRYVSQLLAWNKVYNLTKLTTEADVWDALVLPSIRMLVCLPVTGSCIDLGSGGGVPGLICAICQPKTSWVLVDKVSKKSAFLRQTACALGMPQVAVYEGDFLAIPQNDHVRAIVSRGSAPLATQIEITQKWRSRGVPLFSVQTHESLSMLPDLGVAAEVLLRLSVKNNLCLVKVV